MGEQVSDGRTSVERRPLELVVTRTFDAPVRLVYEAWSKAELFRQWWVPKSAPMSLLSCEMDVRTGGGYRLAFGEDTASAMVFFGKYLEVVPLSRMVWTNDEGEDSSITTVTFEDKGDQTLVVMTQRYPTEAALEEDAGSVDAAPEQFGQLDALLETLREKA